MQWYTPPTDWKQGTKDVINFCLHLFRGITLKWGPWFWNQQAAEILKRYFLASTMSSSCATPHLATSNHEFAPMHLWTSEWKFQSFSLCQWQRIARLQGRKASVQKRPDLVHGGKRRAENDSMDFEKDAEVDDDQLTNLVLLATPWAWDQIALPCIRNITPWEGQNVDGRLGWWNVIAKGGRSNAL